MYALSRYNLKRIAIVDFDVHHGNGTQNIFYDDDRVFYISLHQYPHYPGTGYLDETGSGRGKGFNMNVPMQPFSGEVDYIRAFLDLVIPVLRDFRPELILVSAGFDGHAEDPLSCIDLRNSSYYKMMHAIIYISRTQAKGEDDGRFCTGIVLEGGYSYKALAGSILKVIDVIGPPEVMVPIILKEIENFKK